MAKRKRDIQLKFRVTPQEREMIETKMAQFGTTNMAAYLRKMAIDGYVVKLDLRSCGSWCPCFGIPATTSTSLPAALTKQAASMRPIWRTFSKVRNGYGRRQRKSFPRWRR